MGNYFIRFQNHAHISPRLQKPPVNQSFFVTQNDPLTKKAGQIKFGFRVGLPHDRPGLDNIFIAKQTLIDLLVTTQTHSSYFQLFAQV